MAPPVTGLDAADAYCREMVRHYENFTVASRLSPRSLRRDLTRVYAFCRYTDDLGDESGDRALATRRLTRWRDDVEESFVRGERTHPVLVALAETAGRTGLDAQPFLDLIDANLQDQRVATYEDWSALRAYCARSAAPVGRMVLRVFGIDDPAAPALSDDVCIGLQLANFAQDVSVDARLGRTYLLQCEIREHGDQGAVRLMCERARALLASGRELEARALLASGRELETLAPARLRVQLALYRLGGEAILDAVAACNYRTATQRPVVETPARLRIVSEALARGVRRGTSQRTAVRAVPGIGDPRA
jgi:squalene synthase HpnC